LFAGTIASRRPGLSRAPNEFVGIGGFHSIISPLRPINFVLLALMSLTFAVPAGAQSGGYGAGGYSTQTYSSTLHGILRGTEGATGKETPVWRSRPEGLDQWRKSSPSRRAPTTPEMPKAQGYTNFPGYYGAYARPRAAQEAEAGAAAQAAEAAAAQEAAALAEAQAAAAREADAKKYRARIRTRPNGRSKR